MSLYNAHTESTCDSGSETVVILYLVLKLRKLYWRGQQLRDRCDRWTVLKSAMLAVIRVISCRYHCLSPKTEIEQPVVCFTCDPTCNLTIGSLRIWRKTPRQKRSVFKTQKRSVFKTQKRSVFKTQKRSVLRRDRNCDAASRSSVNRNLSLRIGRLSDKDMKG